MSRNDNAIPEWLATLLGIINANNADAFVAAFSEDGVVDDWGRRFLGHEAIRHWSRKEFIGMRVELKVIGCRVTDRYVDVAAIVGGDGFNGPSRFRFTTEDGNVCRMRIRGGNIALNLLCDLRSVLTRPATV